MKRGGLLFLVVLCLAVCCSCSEKKTVQDPFTHQLLSSFQVIDDFLNGKPTSEEHLLEAMEKVRNNFSLLHSDGTVIGSAFGLVDAYDRKYGPLFINPYTSKGISRKAAGKPVHLFMVDLQQALIDQTYTSENLEKFPDILENVAFRSCRNFPGEVASPSDPTVSCTVKIRAQNRRSFGTPTMNEKLDVRRPTGCYAAPGAYVTVKVPASLVNKGYSIRVNAHSWDNKVKAVIKRLDRVSIVYPIAQETTVVANPLGGGIYIDVPYLEDQGIVEIEIRNAVRSPFFSARSWDKMTVEEWKGVQRKYPAPWADFESDKVMINLPTSWVRNFDDPSLTMSNWEKGADAVMELRGLDPDRFDKTLLYMQVDLQMRGDAFYPGYPQTNDMYKPQTDYHGNHSSHYLLTGMGNYTAWHELGHSIRISKFRGETEALVNFLYVAVYNQKFGQSLNDAFGGSFVPFVKGPDVLDQVSRTWTVTPEFREGKDMDHSSTPKDQMRYQHRGYAKYVEIVHLFGWKVLQQFWYDMNVAYENGKTSYAENVNNDPVDDRILRLSKCAGYDLRPLIHFWGIQPENPARLEADIQSLGLNPSRAIYDQLKHYQQIIPMSKAEFLSHARFFYPDYDKPKNNLSDDHGEGWYHAWEDRYTEKEGEAGRQALQRILDTYFPQGRPA